MTHELFLQAVRDTRMFLPDDFETEDPRADDPWEQARHCAWMLREVLTWGEDQMDKGQRWLGFVQGWLWAQHLASVAVLKSVNQGPVQAAAPPVAS